MPKAAAIVGGCGTLAGVGGTFWELFAAFAKSMKAAGGLGWVLAGMSDIGCAIILLAHRLVNMEQTPSGTMRRIAIAGSVVCAVWAVFWLAQILQAAVPPSFRAIGTTAYFALLACALALAAAGRIVVSSAFWPFPAVCGFAWQEAMKRHRLETAALGALATSLTFVVFVTIVEARLRRANPRG